MLREALRTNRRHTTASENDIREPGARDRDRILYSSAFRRLAEVTQVVAAETGHVFHNRLTHSLQVAQVGRRISERLVHEYPEPLEVSTGLSPDVVEAACLAHDLGHPPFGHTAETELNKLANAIGGFEGNAQSFRIVTKLAFRRRDTPGLDLTRASLAGLLKYPWLRGQNLRKQNKWGAYESEKFDYDFARELEPLELKSTLEAQLMDWADDITYAVHDVEDFYRAGRIPLHLLTSELDDRERRHFFDNLFEERRKDDDEVQSRKDHLKEVFSEMLSDLFPMGQPYTGTASQRGALRNLTGVLIGRYITGVKLGVHGGLCALDIDQNLKDEIFMLKELTWTYVISAPSLASHQHGERKVIAGLHEAYVDAALGSAPTLAIFPPYYQERLRDSAEDESRKRICVDLIAGMTEKQAVATYHRLNGIALGRGLEELLS